MAFYSQIQYQIQGYNQLLEGDPTKHHGDHTVILALYFLMQAVLPWEAERQTAKREIVTPPMANRWHRSRAAYNSPHEFNGQHRGGVEVDFEYAYGGPSLSPFTNLPPRDGRTKTLKMVKNAIDQVLKPQLVYSPILINSIQRACLSMPNQLQFSGRGWLKWEFDWPEYDGKTSAEREEGTITATLPDREQSPEGGAGVRRRQ